MHCGLQRCNFSVFARHVFGQTRDFGLQPLLVLLPAFLLPIRRLPQLRRRRLARLLEVGLVLGLERL